MPLIIVIIFLYMPYIISYYKLLQCCEYRNTPKTDEKPKADSLERIRQVKGMKYTSCLARMAL